MRQPYAGESDYRGYPTLTDEQVYERMKSALERDVQLLAHCNGDRAAEQYLSVMERLERETGRRLRRPVMIHAQLLDLDQLDKVMTVKAMKGRVVLAKDVAFLVGKCIGRTMIPRQGERLVIGEEYGTIACMEGAKFQTLQGVARIGSITSRTDSVRTVCWQEREEREG